MQPKRMRDVAEEDTAAVEYDAAEDDAAV